MAKYKPITEIFYDEKFESFGDHDGLCRRIKNSEIIKQPSLYFDQIENFDRIKESILVTDGLVKIDDKNRRYFDMQELAKLADNTLLLGYGTKKDIGKINCYLL